MALTVEQAEEALRLAREAVGLAADNVVQAEKDLDAAYEAMRKASAALKGAHRRDGSHSHRAGRASSP